MLHSWRLPTPGGDNGMATHKKIVKTAPAKKAPAKKTAPAKKALPAKAVAKKAAPERKSVHHVYVIRVQRITPTGKFDYYVGSTGLRLEDKWERYVTLSSKRLSGYFLNGHVKAIALEPTLMNGWGPYESDDLAKFAEGELALHLQDRGYVVHSDELKWALRRRIESGMVFEGPVWNSRAHKRLAQEAAKNRPNRSRAGASTGTNVSSSKAAVKKATAKKAAVKKVPVKKVVAAKTTLRKAVAKKAVAKKAASPR